MTRKLTSYEPARGWGAFRLGDLWPYRELLYFLTWRDVKVRYKQAVLGALWAILQPVLTMVVFTVVFNRFLGVKSPYPGLPYAVFSLSGLVAWQYFAGALGRCGTSLVGSATLLTKIYFPRLVIPISSVLSGLVDFAISFVVLLVIMAGYGIAPGWQIVFIPFFLVLAVGAALSMGLWLSALNVLYRDVQYIIPFFIQLGMFFSPVIYPMTQIPAGAARVVVALNPMTGVIGGFRWALLGQPFPGVYLWISIGVVAVVMLTGLIYFRRTEHVFADVV